MRLSDVFKKAKDVLVKHNDVLIVTELARKVSDTFSLSDIRFELSRGKGLAVVGGNGQGKSTLIRLLAGLSKADQGNVIICGVSSKQWSKASKHIGYIQQYKSLPDDLTVKEYLTHQLRLRRADKNCYKQLIELAGLKNCQNNFASRMSGGNQRKLQILCAIGHAPDLLILDEPTSGLDAASRQTILAFIGQLKLSGMSLVMSSHHLEEIEALADDVLVLHQGRQVSLTSVGKFLQNKSSDCLELQLYQKEASHQLLIDSLNGWIATKQGCFSVEDSEQRTRLYCHDEQCDFLPAVVAHLSGDNIRLASISSYHADLATIMHNIIHEIIIQESI